MLMIPELLTLSHSHRLRLAVRFALGLLLSLVLVACRDGVEVLALSDGMPRIADLILALPFVEVIIRFVNGGSVLPPHKPGSSKD
jgi:hypothetical protein